MQFRLFEAKEPQKGYNIDEDIKVVCLLLGIDETDLADIVDVTDPEAFYEYAFTNGISLNDIKWQAHKDDDTEGRIILAHGSKSVLDGPIRLNASGPDNDFGSGFYCGTSIKQAGMFVSEEPNASIYLVAFEPGVVTAATFRVDVEWMIAIAYFRGLIKEYEDHPLVQKVKAKVDNADYVIAPIADNRIYATVEAFIMGEITDSQCLHALSATYLGYQYVFKKENCLQYLDIVDHLYLCQSEKNMYKVLNSVESNTSLNKAIIAKTKYEDQGQYIYELLGDTDEV